MSGKLESSQYEVEHFLRETHSNPFRGDPMGAGQLSTYTSN